MANTSLLLFHLCVTTYHIHRRLTRVPTVSSLSIVRTCEALSSPGSQQCLQEQNVYFLAETSLCCTEMWFVWAAMLSFYEWQAGYTRAGKSCLLFYPCCPWCLSADILKQPFLCYLNVQIIVRDSKASDGNDYGVENNRFPLASADCWLATLTQPVKKGWWLLSALWTSSGEMAVKH